MSTRLSYYCSLLKDLSCLIYPFTILVASYLSKRYIYQNITSLNHFGNQLNARIIVIAY